MKGPDMELSKFSAHDKYGITPKKLNFMSNTKWSKISQNGK